MPAQTLEQRAVPECFVSDHVPGFVKTASNLHKLLLTLEKKDSENVSVSEDIFQKHCLQYENTEHIHPSDNNHKLNISKSLQQLDETSLMIKWLTTSLPL